MGCDNSDVSVELMVSDNETVTMLVMQSQLLREAKAPWLLRYHYRHQEWDVGPYGHKVYYQSGLYEHGQSPQYLVAESM